MTLFFQFSIPFDIELSSFGLIFTFVGLFVLLSANEIQKFELRTTSTMFFESSALVELDDVVELLLLFGLSILFGLSEVLTVVDLSGVGVLVLFDLLFLVDFLGVVELSGVRLLLLVDLSGVEVSPRSTNSIFFVSKM